MPLQISYNPNMYRIYALALLLCTGVLSVITIGCSTLEKLPEVDKTLPAGYLEKHVPRDFVKGLAGNIGHDVGWIRCFTCGQDWDGLNKHMAVNLKAYSYKETTDDWMPILAQNSKIPEEHAANIFKVYSSPSGVGHVMAINLEYIRSVTSQSFDTSGDYLVAVGYDLLSNY